MPMQTMPTFNKETVDALLSLGDDSSDQQTTVAKATLARSNRGPSFTKNEDLLVCKCFIRRSECPITGNSQKGEVFVNGMHKDYKDLIAEQFAADQRTYNASSVATREALEHAGIKPSNPYHERTAQSVFNRFKGTIAPRIMKFMAIKETLPMDSGTSLEDFYLACKAVYEKRFPKFGNFDDLRPCKDYLEDKAKFASYYNKMKAEESEKKVSSVAERPSGSKMAKQAAKDTELIKKAVSVMQTSEDTSARQATTSPTKAAFIGKASGLMDHIGSAIATYCETQSAQVQWLASERFVATLDTPQKAEWKRNQFQIFMAEQRMKLRNLQEKATVDSSTVPSTILTSNYPSASSDDLTSVCLF